MPTETLTQGFTAFPFNNIAFPANGTGGTSFALPKNREGTGWNVGWFTSYTGAPSAVSVALQASDDNTNWTQIDSTTNTAGEFKTVVGIAYKFIRALLTTRTGGTNISVGLFL